MQSSSRDVQIAEEWAKEYKHNKFPSNPTDEDGLVVNEIAAIHLYTMSLKKELHCKLFGSMNAALKKGEEKPNEVKPFFKWIRLLQQALFKLPPAKILQAIFCAERPDWWEGKDASPRKRFKEFMRDRKPTKENKMMCYPMWAFTCSSCTVHAEVHNVCIAEKDYFGGDYEKGFRVMYTIDGGSSALDIQRYSAVKADEEVLLPCGTGFYIKSVVGSNDGLIMVHLEEIEEMKEVQEH